MFTHCQLITILSYLFILLLLFYSILFVLIIIIATIIVSYGNIADCFIGKINKNITCNKNEWAGI